MKRKINKKDMSSDVKLAVWGKSVIINIPLIMVTRKSFPFKIGEELKIYLNVKQKSLTIKKKEVIKEVKQMESEANEYN
jgi:hypothetical protein